MAMMTQLRRMLAPSAPGASIQIAADRVTGVSLGRGSGAVVTAVASEGLPDGAVVPSANASNIVDRVAVERAVNRVLRKLPGTPTRVGLVVPDSAAKVSLTSFEQVPTRLADLDQLVRWQARKTAPFRVEDAQVAYSPGRSVEGGGREFVVSLMRRDIVEEYEAVCLGAGGHAGVVDLASFSLVNGVLSAGSIDEADWLLVHVAQGYSTIAVVRNSQLILFRNRPAEGDGNLADLVHQTMMYYEDRLEGSGFGRAFLAASTANTDAGDAAVLRASLETRLGTPVEEIGSALTISGPGAAGLLPDLIAAPVGLLLRERPSAEAAA
jgi:Tfp pilus assembly PilM family ATPase